jgi:hypothetical protein
MLDIFTALLGILSICALAGAVNKIMFSPKKVWDEADWMPEQIAEPENFEELRKGNPHIWLE